MSPGMSSRKKPTCHSCGMPMEGHKRPNGSPVCPRDSHSPSPTRSRTTSTTPDRHSRVPPSLLSRISPRVEYDDEDEEAVTFSPTPSGYWHRQNPNWVEPEHYARIPTHAVHRVPQRGETQASWHSTEIDAASATAHAHGTRLSPAAHQAAEDDIEEVDDSDAASQAHTATGSPAPSSTGSFTRLARGLSKVIGRGTPLASVYNAPSDEVVMIEHAAQEHGFAATAVHRRPHIKAEPPSPGGRVGEGSRSSVAREGSWWVFVGRDRRAVDALAQHAAAATVERAGSEREPYDYDAGLVREKNERVGAYPVNPRDIRQTFCDVIIAAVVSAFCAVWFLSWM